MLSSTLVLARGRRGQLLVSCSVLVLVHCSIVVELCILGGIDVTHIVGKCASLMSSSTTLPSFMLHDFVFCLFVVIPING